MQHFALKVSLSNTFWNAIFYLNIRHKSSLRGLLWLKSSEKYITDDKTLPTTFQVSSSLYLNLFLNCFNIDNCLNILDDHFI